MDAADMDRCRSFLIQHMGLGDLLICYALTQHFLRKLPLPMGLFVDSRYLDDAKHLYRDVSKHRLVLIPRIRPIIKPDLFTDVFEAVESTGKPFVNLTMFRENNAHYLRHGHHFDQCFYHYAGVEFQKKFDNFKCAQAPSHEIDHPKDPYVLYHDDPSRKYWIDQDEIHTPKSLERYPVQVFKAKTIFATRRLWENADEIHCINSAFLNYVDFLKPQKPKLFWHYYSRSWEGISDPTLQCDWQIIK